MASRALQPRIIVSGLRSALKLPKRMSATTALAVIRPTRAGQRLVGLLGIGITGAGARLALVGRAGAAGLVLARIAGFGGAGSVFAAGRGSSSLAGRSFGVARVVSGLGDGRAGPGRLGSPPPARATARAAGRSAGARLAFEPGAGFAAELAVFAPAVASGQAAASASDKALALE